MENTNHKYLCWLAGIKGIGRTKKFALLRAAGEASLFSFPVGRAEDLTDSAKEPVFDQVGEDCAAAARILYTASEEELLFLCGEAYTEKARGKKAVQILLNARKEEAEEVEEKLQREEIIFVSALEKGFPVKLKEIPDPPFGIYCKGKMPAEDEPAAAIIGARLASGYGREQARRFGRRIGSCGISVISGMARGVDGIAQKAALDAGGRSYAVLGCGVDICYPEENRELYERLLQEGGVLSEYPPGTFPEARLFPPRNRIISGLSDLVLVIEARKKSGTLITVDMALEQGRDVYALPGRVCDSLSDGCNRLIRQGAGPATCPEDILEFFFGATDSENTDSGEEKESEERNKERIEERKEEKEKEAEKEAVSGKMALMDGESVKGQDATGRKKRPPLEEAVLKILTREDEMHLERILEALGQVSLQVSIRELITALMHLIIDGRVEESPAGYYRKI